MKILFAEDEKINAMLTIRLLEKSEHEVVHVKDGSAALSTYQENTPFDLILMDVQMPGMDGLEAASAIRAFESSKGMTRTPIIAMTAFSDSGDEKRCREAGMDHYLVKPVNFEKLEEAMQQLKAE